MKIATNIRKPKDMGFQLILNDSGNIIGVNLLCKSKILIKKRFDNPVLITNKQEENDLVNRVFSDSIVNR